MQLGTPNLQSLVCMGHIEIIVYYVYTRYVYTTISMMGHIKYCEHYLHLLNGGSVTKFGKFLPLLKKIVNWKQIYVGKFLMLLGIFSLL